MLRLLSLISLAALALLAASCPRSGTAVEARAAEVRGTHPWDQPGYEPIVPPMPTARREEDPQAVEKAPDRGPAMPRVDTLDEKLLLGDYIQVAQVATEKMILMPVNEQDRMSLQPNGYAIWTRVVDFKETPMDGNWSKPKPGYLQVTFGGGSMELQSQLYEGKFLYLWSSRNRTGFWFARIPQRAAPRILASDFDTSRGHLHISRYVGASWEGEVSGDQPLRVSGFYNAGILTVRWEALSGSGAGYAAFVCDEDFSSLHGTWWLDDWEASPFGGGWEATRAAASAAPPAGAAAQ